MSEYWDYYGVPLPKLPNGQVPIGAVVSIKSIDESGHINYQEFKSPEIHAIEALGMLDTFQDTLRDHIKHNSRKID